MCECRNKVEKTEVSRGHSSEEASVIEVERRAESLKQESLIGSSKSQAFEKTKG